MKHSIDYYIEHIEPMIDNLNRQQEIQIDNTKFLVLKVRTKDVTRILIANQYNWNGVHYWVYNTNTKQVENIIHSTYHSCLDLNSVTYLLLDYQKINK